MIIFMNRRELAAAERAAARKNWPVRVYRLGQEPPDRLVQTTTAKERLAMMWPLALEAWSLTRHPLPAYRREDAPVRLVRRSLEGDIKIPR